jgi:hypothetical protein
VSNAVAERLTEIGFERADGRYRALPTDYTIIGGSGPNDRTAVQLDKLYPEDSAKHRRARAIVAGCRDSLRAHRMPPPGFVETCRNGIIQDVIAADLGPDKSGRSWVVMIVGRKRIQSRRILDAEGAKAKPPEPPRLVHAVIAPFAINTREAFDMELRALEMNARSNVSVAMLPSEQAEHARMLADKELRAVDIVPRVGAHDVAHVAQLLALFACERAVQDAADARKLAPAEWEAYAKLDPIEQVRRIGRKLAGNGKAAKDAAAEPRPRALNAASLVAIEGKIADRVREFQVDPEIIIPRGVALRLVGLGVALAAGRPAGAMSVPEVKEALMAAGVDESGKVRRGPVKSKLGASG